MMFIKRLTMLFIFCFLGFSYAIDQIQKGIHFASYHGDLDQLRYLFNDPTQNPNVKDKKGDTALHIASAKGHTKVVSFLLENGADINALGSSGDTAIHRAIWYNQTQTAFLLIQKGADIHLLNKAQNSLVHLAAYKGNLEVLKTLIEANKANIHVKDEQGRSPLHDAVFNSHLDVVEYLIKKGIDVNTLDYSGRSPLYEAVDPPNFKMIQILVFNGADLVMRDKNGKRPISEAFMEKNPNIKSFFLSQEFKMKKNLEGKRGFRGNFKRIPKKIKDLVGRFR